MLARLGGDEFAVLLTGTSCEAAVSVAERLRAGLDRPFTLEGIMVRADVSIGIALSPDHGSDLSVLLRRADIAMYKAKTSQSGHRVSSTTDDTAEGRPLTVTVNLSPSLLVDSDLPEQVAALLAARWLPPSALQLEITEEFLMADRARARDILGRLRDGGVQIAVDDFGTGYSSLAYLRELPIDELKLDRSFVFPMADDARAAALVVSTIGLAHSLGLRMVAEGVEDEVALSELTRHGCDEAQGYYLSRPLPAAALDLWVDRRGQLASSGRSVGWTA